MHQKISTAIVFGLNRLDFIYDKKIESDWPEIEQITTPQHFAECYKGTELHTKVLVPVLIAKALFVKDSSMLNVLLPHLTEEVRLAFAELLDIQENIEYISLVPENEYTWSFPVPYIVYRGKQIYNNLHPDDQQEIPIDMEKVRMALSEESPWLLPELPTEEYGDVKKVNNEKENEGNEQPKNISESKAFSWIGKKPDNFREEHIDLYCSIFASHCIECTQDEIKYFIWGPKEVPNISLNNCIVWNDTKGLLAAYIRYPYTDGNITSIQKNNVNNLFKVKGKDGFLDDFDITDYGASRCSNYGLYEKVDTDLDLIRKDCFK